jgi:hypothetical protein
MANHPGERRDVNIQRIQRELLDNGNRGPRRHDDDRGEPEPPPRRSGAQPMPDRNQELIETLKEENDSLRGIVAELRQMLEQGGHSGESSADMEREYQAMLEEKAEIIRELHANKQDLEKQLAEKAAIVPTPDRNELLALSDELERERCQTEQERRQLEQDQNQLREDEESMMRQMREMELQMAKERAELARQRNELQRLHSEIRHELELAQRDAAVNERLKLLQRRHREVEEGTSGGDRPAPKTPTTKKDSGSGMSMFKRLFGGDK